MSTYTLRRGLPSCFVTKDLLSRIEKYLRGEMRHRLGANELGDHIDYTVSITEKFGTEKLSRVDEFVSEIFSDSTKKIVVSWKNGYAADVQLKVEIDFSGFHSSAELTVRCTARSAREIAVGVGDAILRVLEPNRNYNWILNPFEIPWISIASGTATLMLLATGFGALIESSKSETGLSFILAGAVFLWIFISSVYFRPIITFDSRRRELLNKSWIYFSLGCLTFVLFGTLFPLARTTLLGF